MVLGALLAVVVLGFPLVFLIGLVHGINRVTQIGVERGHPPTLAGGPAEDSRDQVDLGSERVDLRGMSVPRIGPFVSTCLVLVVVCLAIALAVGLASN
jgi:hypothetical protein